MPPTIPVGDIVATVDGAILHVPPVTLLVSGSRLPIHTGTFPAIGPGAAFTVTTVVCIADVGPQKDICVTIAVPALMPVTTPLLLMVATVAGAQNHPKPGNDGIALLSTIVSPAQMGALPVIGAPPAGTTVTVKVDSPQAVV